MAYQLFTYRHNKTLPEVAWLKEPFVYDFFTLWQVGERRLFRDTIGFQGPHEDRFWDIGYVTEGSGVVSIHGSVYQIRKGDCLVRMPVHTCMISSKDTDELQICYIRFELHDSERGEHPFACMNSVLLEKKDPVRRDHWGLADLFDQLLREIRYENRHLLLMAGSYVNQILVAAYRNYLGQVERNIDTSDHMVPSIGGKREIAERAVQYMNERVLDLKELSSVADVLGYSYSYLSHVFREEMGTSLQAYFSKRRILMAMQFLHDEDNTVTRVAELLSYQSIHSFSKAFKKQTGQSPSEYQFRYANEKKASY
ncbi:AraC family transcriptional regulator [Paenibacillus sp. 2RAB27]|uniref:helix-turn-helix transcriptional regulator n=1 Tax=Paenibacillus sp. 2RAB27 TaxID=3232991 RepID=UPI003F969043